MKSILKGGYAGILSQWPRRPGDTAILESSEITAGADPSCLSFWIHLHGGGVGYLR